MVKMGAADICRAFAARKGGCTRLATGVTTARNAPGKSKNVTGAQHETHGRATIWHRKSAILSRVRVAACQLYFVSAT
jgi:hypothetical protein